MMTISAPFNWQHGGVTNSGFAYEACMSGDVSTIKKITVDYAPLEPGCCGFKSVGSVSGGIFAYYRVSPQSTNNNLRVVTTSASPKLEIYMRYSLPPDHINYDFKATATISPWQIEIPQYQLRCGGNVSTCESLYVGVRGMGGGEYTMNYEIAGYWEFNFPNFACSESSAVTHSSKCSELGLNQLGDATFTYDQLDPIRPSVMRLTDQAGGSQTSAVWYNTKVQVENGFETSFSFKMSSHCTAIPGEITTGCGAGDGLAFVIQGSDTPNHIGCGGGAMGFADSFDPAEAGCSGISQAFAVEFDTWHNPELRDVNVR